MKKFFKWLLRFLGFQKDVLSFKDVEIDLNKLREASSKSVEQKYREILRKRGVKDYMHNDINVISINDRNAVRKINNRLKESGRAGLDKGVWRKMTTEEKEDYALKQFNGAVIYRDGEPMVMMGSGSYKRLVDFESEMNNKYADLGIQPFDESNP